MQGDILLQPQSDLREGEEELDGGDEQINVGLEEQVYDEEPEPEVMRRSGRTRKPTQFYSASGNLRMEHGSGWIINSMEKVSFLLSLYNIFQFQAVEILNAIIFIVVNSVAWLLMMDK